MSYSHIINRSHGLATRALRWLRRFWGSSGRLRLGLVMVGFWIVVGALAPIIAPYPPTEPQPDALLLAPSSDHWFGTDSDGMDVFSRTLYAPRIDLGIALAATSLAFFIGVPIGAFTGFFGGRQGVSGVTSNVIMRAIDVSLAFPVFVIALALVAVLGRNASNVIIAVCGVGIPVFVWLTRSQVLSVRERTFVEAARCSGNSELRIAYRHVLRNSLAASLTQVSVILGSSILLTAGLSFVGAGVRVPTPEWGLMISGGAQTIVNGQWWPALFPGLALISAVFGFSLVGDGIRSYMDPRERTAPSRAIEEQ